MDDLEKPMKPEEESPKPVKPQPEAKPAPEEEEPIKIVLGKGKVPKDEEKEETIKLKKVKPEEKVTPEETLIKKKPEEKKEDKEKPEREYEDVKLRPVEDIEFPDRPGVELEKPESFEFEKEEKPKEKLEKKPKKKPEKKEEEKDDKKLVIGKGKPEDEISDDDIKFRIPKTDKPDEKPQTINLKHFEIDDTKAQQPQKTQELGSLAVEPEKGIDVDDAKVSVIRKDTKKLKKPTQTMSTKEEPTPEEAEQQNRTVEETAHDQTDTQKQIIETEIDFEMFTGEKAPKDEESVVIEEVEQKKRRSVKKKKSEEEKPEEVVPEKPKEKKKKKEKPVEDKPKEVSPDKPIEKDVAEVKPVEDKPEEVSPVEKPEEQPKEEETEEKPEEVSVKPKEKKLKKKKDVPEEKPEEEVLPEKPKEKSKKKKEEKPEEKKPEKLKLTPMKIERKEIKPQKVQFAETKEEKPLFATVKLRKASITPKKEAEPTKLPKFLLKSRIKRFEYPPAIKHLVITELEPVEVDNGILSRNYEEAQKVKKKKVKKIKLPEIEKTELEKYVPYEEEKPEEKIPEETKTKPEKEEKPKEEDEQVQIKIKKGKGKVPEEEKEQETVVLKKLPKKPLEETEEEPKKVQKLKPEKIQQPVEEEEATFKLKPVKPVETGEMEEIEKPEMKPEDVPEDTKVEEVKEVKPKLKKPKEEDVPEEKKLVMGKGKKKPGEPEEEITLKKKQGVPLVEEPEVIKLKPFEKEKPKPEDTEKEITAGKPKPEDIERPDEEIEPKEFSIDDKPKKKKKKPKDEEQPEEKPEEVTKPEEGGLFAEILKKAQVVEKTPEKKEPEEKKRKSIKKKPKVEEKPEVTEDVQKPEVTEPEDIKKEEDEKPEEVAKVEKRKSIKKKPKEDQPEEKPEEVAERRKSIKKPEEQIEEKPEETKKPKMKLEKIEKVEVKQVQPKKFKVEELKPEEPFTIKLKKVKIPEKKEEKPKAELPKFLLKSRIKRFPYPPEMQYPKISELVPPVLDNGVLSRNYKEAQEVIKRKSVKKKLPKKPESDLEKFEPMEDLEKPMKPEEEAPKPVKPQPEAKPAPEEEEPIKIVLGKGKVPKEEEKEETIKLKKVKPEEEVTPEETLIKKKPEEKKEDKEKPEREYEDVKLRPVEDIEFPDRPVVELEKPESFEFEKEKKPKEKPEKKPKKKPEKTAEVSPDKELVMGKGKKKPEEPEEDVKFRIPQKDKPEEEPETIKLKPFKKEGSEDKKPAEETEFEGKIPETSTPVEKTKEKPEKVKKIKKKKPVEEKPEEERPEEMPEEVIPEENKPEIEEEKPVEVKPKVEERPVEEEKPEKKEEKPEKPKLVAQKIERKEVKPTKMKMEQIAPEQPMFTTVKLRKSSVVPKPEAPKSKEPKRLLLKSRITRINYPPAEFKCVYSDLPKVYVDQGILSRNYKEAQKVIKVKVKKPKLPEKEETVLEKYEKFVDEEKQPEEEVEEKVIKPRERPMTKLPEEETVKLKLGKGKVPEEESEQEKIKLRKVSIKEEQEEKVDVTIKKKPDDTIKPQKVDKTDEERPLEPLEEFKFDDAPERTLEKPEIVEFEKEKEPEEEKPKKKKPKEKKPEEDVEEKKLVMGKGKPQPEETPAEISLKKPKPKEPEKTDEETIKLKPFTKEKPEDDEEKAVVIKKKPKPKEEKVEEEVVIIKKKPKEEKSEEEEVQSVFKLRKPSKVEEIESEFTIKKKEETYTEEEASDSVTIKKKPKKKASIVEEAELLIQKEEVIKPEETMLKITFTKKPEEEKPEETVTIKKKPSITEEEVTLTETIKKPRKKYSVSEEVSEEVTIQKKKEPEEEVTLTQTIRKPGKKYSISEEVSEEITIQKQKKPVVEEDVTGESVVLKKKAPKKKYSISEESGELTIQKVEEVPEEVVLKPKSEESQAITLKKPKKPEVEEIVESVTFKPKVEKRKEEVEQEFKIKMGTYEEEEVEMSGKVKLPRRKKPSFAEESSSETIYIEEEEEPVQVAIRRKPSTPYTVEEEEPVQVAIRRKSSVQIQEVQESVSLKRPKPKVVEEVEQEFKIKSGSYQEEEVEMSGKVKLPRKKRPVTFSEEASEETIFIEEEGPQSVKFPLRRKSSYSVQEVEEEVQLGLRKPRKESIVYEEESLELKVKRKPSKPSIPTFHQEDASLQITKIVEEFTDEKGEKRVEGAPLFSICSYIAETEDALNLVEGEKVFVIESNNSDWWFVRKNLTEEKGWVPAVYLRDEPSYTLYVQKKLHEKIDKLPIFEKPGPGAEVFAPKFVEKLQPIHAPDGATVQFECKVEGNPRPQITWFRQTAIIKPSQDFQIFYDDDNVATLIISEVFPEDAGTFTCVAKNAAGFASSTTELIVETPLSDHGSDTTGLSRRSLSRESSLADILEGIPPTFSRKPKAKVVPLNSDVELEVRLVAIPEPEITWTFNGKPVKQTSNLTITTHSDMHMYVSTLKITKVTRGQEGIYSVIAKNREGEANLDIVLKIKTGEPEKPVVVDRLKDVTVSEGEGVVLTAQVTGVPPPKVIWMKDNKPVKLDMTTTGDVYTAVIRNAKTSDAGKYTLEASNPHGKATTNAQVVVQEFTKLHAPLFIERFEEQEVREKGTIKLKAKVKGNPIPTVTWFINNKTLLASPRITEMFDGEQIMLEIVNADSEQDAGDYKCVATNSAGSATHGARVTVDVAKVSFTKKLPPKVEIDENGTTTLECETSHTVSTTWYHNNKELSGMDNREIIQEGRVQKLVIKRASPNEQGDYCCTVKDQKTQTKFIVHGVKPEFVRKLEDYEVKELECAVLEVEVTSDNAKVVWQKDGLAIEPKPGKIDVEKRGTVHKLFIRSTSVHDEGEYTCRLEDDECSAEVTVIELPPEICTHLQDTSVPKGEKACLEVELTKGDALVRWFKDDSELLFSEHVQLSIDGKRQKLKIYQADENDAGVYSCKVGDQVSTARLTVEEPEIEFVTRLPDVTMIPVGSDAEFVVELSKDVDVKWFKKGKEIKNSDRFAITTSGKKRKLVIKKVTLDDQCDISCVAMNVKTTSKLKIEIIETAPTIISGPKEYKVQKGEDITITVKFTGTPQPKDEWTVNGTVVKTSKRVQSKVEDGEATLTIKKVEETDVGSYTLKLKNNVGEASAELTLIIIEVPDAPGTPEVVEVTEKSVTLHWKEPKSDGNSPITSYILEYHDKEEFLTWHEINVTEQTYKMTEVVKNHEYNFKVSAVNAVGKGKTSESSKYVKIETPGSSQPPLFKQSLEDKSCGVGKSITLSCVVTGVPDPEIKWFKNGKALKMKTITYSDHVAKLTIENVTETSGGLYSCKASNAAGTAETSCKLLIQEIPTLRIDDDKVSQPITVLSQIKQIIVFTGFPKPEITWLKDGCELITDKRVTTYVDEDATTLAIYSTDRKDTGMYTVKATNVAGSASLDIKIRIIDKPGRPETLDIKDIEAESLVVLWTPPADDGGIDISKYSLEKCELGKTTWTKVADIEREMTSYIVQRLQTNAEYMFRIFAQNPVGVSEPMESEPVTIKSNFNKPSPPVGPMEISGMTDTSCAIAWGLPSSDGGSPIIDYTVEKKESSEVYWTKVGSSKELRLVVPDLAKNKSYDIRVTARNRVGSSLPLCSDEPVVAGKMKTPPSPPNNLLVKNIASKSVTLHWEPPTSNGGSELTGYVVEKQPKSSDKWTKVVTLDAGMTTFTIENLKEKSEFYFRVFAENAIGLSSPTTTSLVSLKTHATVPSPPTAPLEIRSTGANSVMVAWGIPESDGGAPIEGYKIAVRDVKKTMWMEVGRVGADIQKLTIKDLQENHEYLIRIYARNEVGMSDPLESDEPFKVTRPAAGDEDTDVEDSRLDKDTPSLSFTTTTTASWMRDAGMDADIHSYSRGSLLRRSEYFFRIWFYAKHLFK